MNIIGIGLAKVHPAHPLESIHNTKTFDKSWQTFFVPCLNFPSSFLMGKSNQNKQCQQISSFCLISFFWIFKELMIGLIFIDSQTGSDKFWYFLRFQIIMFETLKKWNQIKNRYLLTLFILIWFTIQKRRGKIQTGDKKCLPRFVKSFCIVTWL